MTKQQLKNKIKDLEFWLENNLGHPDRTTIETDLRNLRTQLEYDEYVD
jgi:hypothetical protein